MEEVTIKRIEWSAPEYNYKERNADWFWTIGLITLIVCVLALWMHNYLFSIFILISGCCLVLFTLRHPQEINFAIETEGLTIGKDKYVWKNLKCFHIKKDKQNPKLLIETSKYFLPIYTIPIPSDLVGEIKESLLKFIPNVEMEESKSMQLMEKLGF